MTRADLLQQFHRSIESANNAVKIGGPGAEIGQVHATVALAIATYLAEFDGSRIEASPESIQVVQ